MVPGMALIAAAQRSQSRDCFAVQVQVHNTSKIVTQEVALARFEVGHSGAPGCMVGQQKSEYILDKHVNISGLGERSLAVHCPVTKPQLCRVFEAAPILARSDILDDWERNQSTIALRTCRM